MMTYHVKEIFFTLQGEGANAGRPAVFCRFAGCNLWSGREADRSSATCRFCDTDFVGTDGAGGGRFENASSLADAAASMWPTENRRGRFVICTGGEPLLQLDARLIDEFHARGFEVGVETNGTVQAPEGIDWLCVSPKAGTTLKQRRGNELKVVVPQPGLVLDDLLVLDFERFYLQPMDGPDLARNTQWTVDHCMRDPRWHLSLQTHKVIGIR